MPSIRNASDFLQVRLKPGLKEDVAMVARSAGRTLTKEVERALEEHLNRRAAETSDPFAGKARA